MPTFGPLVPVYMPPVRPKKLKKVKKRPLLVILTCPDHASAQVVGNHIACMCEEFLQKRDTHKCKCGKTLDYRNATQQEIYYYAYSILGEFKKNLDPNIVDWLYQTDYKMFGWIKRMRTNLLKQLAKELPPELREREINQ
jgi:hypothetical protein